MNREALKEQEISGALLKENARLRAGIKRIRDALDDMSLKTKPPATQVLLAIASLCTKLLAGEAIDD